MIETTLKAQKAQSKNGSWGLPKGIWNSDRDRESNKMEASLCLHSENKVTKYCLHPPLFSLKTDVRTQQATINKFEIGPK